MPLKVDSLITNQLTVGGSLMTRNIVVIPVPTTPGETVTVETSGMETILKIDGDIQVDFNLEIIPTSNTLGDKLFLTFYSSSDTYVITAIGGFNFNNCGPDNPPSEHTVDDGTTVIPLFYDGSSFYGMDYC